MKPVRGRPPSLKWAEEDSESSGDMFSKKSRFFFTPYLIFYEGIFIFNRKDQGGRGGGRSWFVMKGLYSRDLQIDDNFVYKNQPFWLQLPEMRALGLYGLFTD